MMNKNELNFDKNGYLYDISIKNQKELINISINIDYIVKDEIESIFKNLVLDIINNFDKWYEKVVNFVKKETNSKKIEIATIYIHNFKKDGKYIFGLSFISELDHYSEHGIGMSLTVDDYNILEFGDEEIAFIIM